jgi:hypothetical protein
MQLGWDVDVRLNSGSRFFLHATIIPQLCHKCQDIAVVICQAMALFPMNSFHTSACPNGHARTDLPGRHQGSGVAVSRSWEAVASRKGPLVSITASSASPRPAPLPVFTRASNMVHWNPRAQAGRANAPDFREWQVRCLLSSLPPEVSAALYEWLLTPARPHWLRGLAPLAGSCVAFAEGVLWNLSLADFRWALYEEVRGCWQLLDAPPLALTGMTCNRLLGTHGRRLRQLAEACAQIAGAGPAAAEFAYALACVMA